MGQKIDYSYYTDIKAQVVQVLSSVGATFSWSTVTQNSIITAAQILEIQNAVNAAHNKINTGCSSLNSSYKGNHNSNHCSTNKGPGNTTYNNGYCNAKNRTVTGYQP